MDHLVQKKNLLLISFHFPPFGGSGVQRALKFAKYLPDCGWRVHVLTVGHRHYPLRDDSLLEELGEDVIVHRVNGWDAAGIAARMGHMLPIGSLEDRIFWRLDQFMSRKPDVEPEARWTQAAIHAADRIIQRHRIDAVMTTSPPHGVQRVGMAIKQKHGIPWIADLRDPVIDNFTIGVTRTKNFSALEALERATIEQSDCTLVTCDDLRDRLARRHSIENESGIVTLVNGFDAPDAPPVSASSSRFILGYVGSFYHDQSIQPLLALARAFFELRPDAREFFELRISGSIATHQKSYILDSDRSFVRERGYLSHAQALGDMASAEALFLMTPENENGCYCIPAKTFEYLAFGSSILALVHSNSHCERLLMNVEGVTIARHPDASSLQQSLVTLFDNWRLKAGRVRRSMNALSAFRRDVLTAKLAGILDSKLAENHVGNLRVDRHLPLEALR